MKIVKHLARFPHHFGTGLIASVVALSTLSGCSSNKWGFPYRAPVQQGNWITADSIALLQKGMMPAQVHYALGTPMLMDIFHPERWDYPFHFKPTHGKSFTRKFSVWFVNGKLDRWEGDEQPNFQPFEVSEITNITHVQNKKGHANNPVEKKISETTAYGLDNASSPEIQTPAVK